MSKSQTCELWRRFTKKEIDTMGFTHFDIIFDVTYEGHKNWSKIISINILRIFDEPLAIAARPVYSQD